MSALRQPNFPAEYYSPSLQPQRANNQDQEIIKSPKVKSRKIVKPKGFSRQNSLPVNLKVLSLLQKGSFGLALVSMTASIGLYISTVQIPKLWSQEYQNLENLQRQERQLVAINETIKHQIANEASQDDNLSISKPESAVFITPAKINTKTKLKSTINQQKTVNLKHNNFGY